jgi:hypothetical protein
MVCWKSASRAKGKQTARKSGLSKKVFSFKSVLAIKC